MLDFESAYGFLKENNSFLLSTHINPDADGIGSIIAIAYLLDKLGKDYKVVLQDPVQEKLGFLNKIKTFKTFDSFSGGTFQYAIILDAPSYKRVGTPTSLIAKDAKILNIDHHTGNSEYGLYNLIEPDYAATAEVVTEFFNEINFKVEPAVATALYAGISADTGRFRFDNTKAKTLARCSSLVEQGADPEMVAKNLFFTTNIETVIALGKVLSSIELCCDNQAAFAHLDYSFLSSKQGEKVDSEGFANYPLSIDGVNVAFLLKEAKQDSWRVNLRSQNHVDVNKLAGLFGGGGHPRASGATISGTIDKVKSALLREVKKVL